MTTKLIELTTILENLEKERDSQKRKVQPECPMKEEDLMHISDKRHRMNILNILIHLFMKSEYKATKDELIILLDEWIKKNLENSKEKKD